MTAAGTSRERVGQVVHEVIRSVLPGLPEQIPGNRHLRELGADSVDRVEIIVAVTERLELAAPLSAFSSVPDIDTLVEVLWEMRRT